MWIVWQSQVTMFHQFKNVSPILQEFIQEIFTQFHAGLLIGQMAAGWKHEMPGLRLSQLLDLYYLNTIVREDFHVCKRESAFNNYIRDMKQTLTEQVGNTITVRIRFFQICCVRIIRTIAHNIIYLSTYSTWCHFHYA